MLDAFADILLVLLIRQGRRSLAHRMEVIGIDIPSVHGTQQVV